MNDELNEVENFKETMQKCGLPSDPETIRAQIAEPDNYDDLPADQKEFLMIRATERWTDYNKTLCEHGEKEFADKYFPVNDGPAKSPLGSVLQEIEFLDKQPKGNVKKSGDWWTLTAITSAIKNIFERDSNTNER